MRRTTLVAVAVAVFGAVVATPAPASAASQPIPGLECIRYKGDDPAPYPPGDPNVTALCLYAQWQQGRYHPDIWIADESVVAKLMAVPFRPMWFAGCVDWIPPNDRDLPTGGHYCRFADSTGYLDLLLQHVSSGPVIADVVLQSVTPCPSAANFAGPGGRAQPTVFRPGNGTWYVNAHAPGGVAFGAPGDVPCAADFDPDGIDDLTVFRPANGNWYVMRHAPGGVAFGGPGDMAVAADYSGDGIADIAVWRPSNARWYVRGLWPDGVTFGVPGDIPVPRDYDGDGRSDPAVYRPQTGEFFTLPSAGGGATRTLLGQWSPHPWAPTRGSLPVPADYDGDHRSDCAVMDRDSGIYRVDLGCNGSTEVSRAGFRPGYDEPVAADYDGDGDANVAVFDWNYGWWKIDGVTSSAYRFGNAGDLTAP